MRDSCLSRIGSTARLIVTSTFGAGMALSQSTFGTIVGTVRDSSGAAGPRQVPSCLIF
jgi:hypothetical protein